MQINFKDIDFNQHSSFQQDNIRTLHSLPLKEQANYLYNLINTFNSSKEEILQCLYKLNDFESYSDKYHYLYRLNNSNKCQNFDGRIYEDVKQIENHILALIKSTSQHNKDNKVRPNFEDLSLFLKNVDLSSLDNSISRKTFSKNLYLSAFFMLGGGKFFKETVLFFQKQKNNREKNEDGLILCSLLYLFLEKSDNKSKKDVFNKIVKTLFELSKENDSLQLEFAYHFGSFFRDDNIRLSLIEAPKTLSIRFLNKFVFCANEKVDEFLYDRYLGDLSSHFINCLRDFIFTNDRMTILDGKIIRHIDEDYTEALLSLINNPRFEHFIINLPESEMGAVKSLLLGFAEKNIVIPLNYFTFEGKDHILKNPQFIASLLSKYQRHNNTPYFLYQMLVDFYLSSPPYFVEIEKTTLENFFELFDKADLTRFFLPFIDNMVENGFDYSSSTDLVTHQEFKNRILNAFGSALQEKEIKGMSELKEAKDLTKGELLTLDFFLLFFVTSLNSDFQHSLMNNWYSLTTGAKLFSGISTLYQKLKDQELNEKETYVFQQLEFFFKTLPELRKIFLSEYEKIREETFNKAKQEQKTNETELTKSTETIKILDEEEIKIIQNARGIFKSLIDSFEIKSSNIDKTDKNT